MSAETLPSQPSVPERAEHLRPLSTEALVQLGHVCRLAMERDDLDEVARQHEEITGTTNPNKLANGLFIGEGQVPMSNDNVYRSVDRRAIDDFVVRGLVAGAKTATNGERGNTSGHATFWNKGIEGKNMKLNTDAHFIIEASRDAAEKGWVKATDVRGIYAKDSSGELQDITKL